MHLRCPHCQNPVELVDDEEFHEVHCPSCGSSFNLLSTLDTETYSSNIRREIGQFQLIERVGVGHFGAVWKARDSKLDRLVAIKIPRREQLSREEVELFFREARAAAQLSHPNIVAVHEVGLDGDSLFIVSDFIEGANLRDWLKVTPMSLKENAKLMATIAEALHHAHEAGVVHRDLKPSNIMMDGDGKPHIMDFGLAKREVGEITMTMDGKVLGTPAYMPPEQASGHAHHADRRSDVYSLGVVLFEMLTSELPFRGETRMLLLQIMRDDPPNPRRLNSRVHKDLETICLKAMAKEPARRYATAWEFAEDLNRYISGQPISARPIGPLEQMARWAKRKPSHALVAALLILITCVSCYAAFKITLTNNQLEAQNLVTRDALEQSQQLSGQLLLERGLSEIESGNPADALHWLAMAAETDEHVRVAAAYNYAALEKRVADLDEIISLDMAPAAINGGLLLWDRRKIAWLDYGSGETRLIASHQSRQFNLSVLQQCAHVASTKQLVAFLGEEIHVVDTASHAEETSKTISIGARITDGAVSANGRWAAAVTADSKLHTLDLTTAKPQRGPLELNKRLGLNEATEVERSPNEELQQIAFGGSRLALVGNNLLAVWDFDRDQWIGESVKLEGYATDLAFDSSGQRIAVEIHEDVVALFRIGDGQLVRGAQLGYGKREGLGRVGFSVGPGASLWFSADGKRVANAFDPTGGLHLVSWDAATRETVFEHRARGYINRGLNTGAHRSGDTVYFRDGPLLRGMSVSQGRLQSPIPIRPSGIYGAARTGQTWTFEFAAFERAADGSYEIDGVLRLWNQPQPESAVQHVPIQSEIDQLVAFKSNGERQVRLLSLDYAESEGKKGKLTVRMGEPIRTDSRDDWKKAVIELERSPDGLQYDADNDRFLAWTPSEVRIFSNRPQPEVCFSIDSKESEFEAAALSADGGRLAVLSQSKYELWDVDSRERLSSRSAEARRKVDTAISADLKHFATLDPLGRITVQSSDGKTHVSSANASFIHLKFAPDSASLLCWGEQDLQSFDLNLTPISRQTHAVKSLIADTAVAVDGSLLAVATRSGDVKYFTYPECLPIAADAISCARQINNLAFGEEHLFVRGDNRGEGELLDKAKTDIVLQLVPPRPSRLTGGQMLRRARFKTGYTIESNGVRRMLNEKAWKQLASKLKAD